MNNSSEARNLLAQRVRTVGCAVDTAGTDWLHERDFDASVHQNESADSGLEPSAAAMSPEPLKILEYLGGLGEDVATAGDLTAVLRIPHAKVEYFLDELVAQEHAFRRNTIGTDSEYGLTGRGRKLLVQMGVI